MLLNLIVIRTRYIIYKRAEDHGHLCDLWSSHMFTNKIDCLNEDHY